MDAQQPVQGMPYTRDRPKPVGTEPSSGRLDSLDYVRGLAVMGIILANIMAMGQPFSAYMYPAAFTVDHSRLEDWLWGAQLVLVDGKMRGLFTLLFGAGIYLFMEKAWAKGATRWLQLRRLAWLGLFGLLHYYLIWRGDILFSYAVSGLIAVVFFLDLKPKTQLVLGLLGYVAGGIFYAVSMIFMQVTVDGPAPDSAALADVRGSFLEQAASDLADGRAETVLRQDGSYVDYARHNLHEHTGDPVFNVIFFAFETLPLVLIGMAFYRFGLFSGSVSQRSLRWAWISLVTGAALTALVAGWMVTNGLTYYATLAAHTGWSHFPRLLMVLGLLVVLTHWAGQHHGWLKDRIVAAGRCAFTNYLGTSIVLLLVFGNWGLDLFGRLGRTELYLVAVAMWVLILAWSKPWLGRFRFGPLEWLWRCLTYGRLFPLKHV